jgi:hypothetical protein
MPFDPQQRPVRESSELSAFGCPVSPYTAPPKTLSFRRASEARQEESVLCRGPETLRIPQPHCNATLSHFVIPSGARASEGRFAQSRDPMPIDPSSSPTGSPLRIRS